MLRKHAQFFASLLWAFDMALVTTAFATAWLLRVHVVPAPAWVRAGEPATMLAISLVTFTLVFRAGGLYHSHRLTSRRHEIFALFQATALSLLLVVAATYFWRDERFSRLTLLLFGALSFGLLASTRTVARRLLAHARRRGMNLRVALVLGTGMVARSVVDRLERRPEYGIKVRGLLARDAAEVGGEVGQARVIGTFGDLGRLLEGEMVDQVYLALPLEQQGETAGLLEALATHHADVKVVPDLYQYMTLHGGIEEVDGLPIIALRNGPVHGWDAVAKRAFDLFFGSLVLVVALPVMAATALGIKLTSPGPVFYTQERMGLDGRIFRMLKFRSMRVGSDAVFRRTSAGDDRTTPIGRFIRRVSIDELPQIVNVLRGDMSLVGPRPDALRFIQEEQLLKQVPNYNLRHKVKAGMTGLAQVEGVRGLAPLEKRVERDLWYIQNWSLWLDFKILVRTALGGFLSKNAY
jgi:Undecaprenyl-phosphate glucose phosphotransferase